LLKFKHKFFFTFILHLFAILGHGCEAKISVSTKAGVPKSKSKITVTEVSSTNANGSYAAGQTISITVTFSQPVTVTGEPYLELNSNTSETSKAIYTSGTDSKTLAMTYTIKTSDKTQDLDYKSKTGLMATNSKIVGTSGEDVDLTLPSPGESGSLSFSKNIKIATVTTALRSTPSLDAISNQIINEMVVMTEIDANDDGDDLTPSGITITYTCTYDTTADGSVTASTSCSQIWRLSFNTTTGKLNWTPSYAQSGTYEFKIVASTGQATDAKIFTIIVNDVNGDRSEWRYPTIRDSQFSVYAALDSQTSVADDQRPKSDSTNGTFQGGMTRGNSGGSAYQFDGVDDYISFDNTNNPYTFANTTFSVSGWIKTTSTSQLVVTKDYAATGSGWGITITALGNLQFGLKGTGGNIAATRDSTVTVNDNQWHHFVAILTTSTTVQASNDGLIYIDGVFGQGARTSVTTYVSPTTALEIGRRRVNGGYFNGLIDGIEIFDYALTTDQIATLYNNGVRGASYAGSMSMPSLQNATFGFCPAKDQSSAPTDQFTSDTSQNGTFMNGATYATEGNATYYSFDGINDSVKVSWTRQNTWTFSFGGWARSHSDTTQQEVFSFAKIGNNSDTASIGFRGDVAGDPIRVMIRDGSNTTLYCDSSMSFVPNTWYHVFATIESGSSIQLYINGSLACSGSGTTVTTVSTDLFSIGRMERLTPAYPFSGEVDDVLAYMRVLSATEISTLANTRGYVYTDCSR
jgi:hypothetical protein